MYCFIIRFLAFLKYIKTCVTASACMPDIRFICVATTERDLRFYDSGANSHILRFHVRSIPDHICTMHYYWSQDLTVQSKLILGDLKGTVRLIEFNGANRGPFRSKSGAKVKTLRYKDLKKVSLFICPSIFEHFLIWKFSCIIH